jgi:hypothetical protein
LGSAVESKHDQRSRSNEARHDLNSFQFSNPHEGLGGCVVR